MSVAAPPAHIALDAGPVSAVDLALYAAASGDHNPLHLDIDAARAAGFDRPIVHGMLTMAYTARAFTGMFGAASLRGLDVRFTGVARVGDAVRVAATLEHFTGQEARYAVRAVVGPEDREVVVGQARVSTSKDATRSTKAEHRTP